MFWRSADNGRPRREEATSNFDVTGTEGKDKAMVEESRRTGLFRDNGLDGGKGAGHAGRRIRRRQSRQASGQ